MHGRAGPYPNPGQVQSRYPVLCLKYRVCVSESCQGPLCFDVDCTRFGSCSYENIIADASIDFSQCPSLPNVTLTLYNSEASFTPNGTLVSGCQLRGPESPMLLDQATCTWSAPKFIGPSYSDAGGLFRFPVLRLPVRVRVDENTKAYTGTPFPEIFQHPWKSAVLDCTDSASCNLPVGRLAAKWTVSSNRGLPDNNLFQIKFGDNSQNVIREVKRIEKFKGFFLFVNFFFFFFPCVFRLAETFCLPPLPTSFASFLMLALIMLLNGEAGAREARSCLLTTAPPLVPTFSLACLVLPFLRFPSKNDCGRFFGWRKNKIKRERLNFFFFFFLFNFPKKQKSEGCFPLILPLPSSPQKLLLLVQLNQLLHRRRKTGNILQVEIPPLQRNVTVIAIDLVRSSQRGRVGRSKARGKRERRRSRARVNGAYGKVVARNGRELCRRNS